MPPPPPSPREETPTSVTCFDCGGNYVTEVRDEARAGRFQTIFCRYCTNGLMSPDQVRRWKRDHAPKS